MPGTISGAIGYRRELTGQGARARPLLLAAGLGGLTGACLLLILPAAAFARIVPVLILIACALVAVQVVGGQLGAVVGRRLSPFALRAAIIAIGLVVAVRLLLG